MTKQNEFAYNSGIECVKEINEQIKIIGDRSTWLVGFLTAIVATLASFAFKSPVFEELINLSGTAPFFIFNSISTTLGKREVFAFSLLIIYLFIIFRMLKRIILPSFAIPAHNYPEKLMKGKFEKIRISEIKRLQSQANQSIRTLNDIRYYLKDSIYAVFYAIPLALAIAIFA